MQASELRARFTGNGFRIALTRAACLLGAGGATWAVDRAWASPLATLVALGVAAGLGTLVLGFAMRRDGSGTGPIVEALRRMAQGDFATGLEPGDLGPNAELGHATNQLAEALGELVARVQRMIERVQVFPPRLLAQLDSLRESTQAQEEACEESASLFANINTSIKRITSDVENLSRTTEEASSSILEMGSAIEEVARNTGALTESVDGSTASIHEMSASIRQVAESADAVLGMAEETATAMTQMDRAIQEVGDHVREASGLTERVSQEAEDGSRAVEATIEGIETIRALARDARDVLERLAERIGEIGEILTVIGSINDETNLLSLNAAIIAAQAGEQGKAFAVVANHVKVLAQRTANSTQEIERRIRAVQEESTNAVKAMSSGMEAVETGVGRSRRAGQALSVIRASAHEASSRVGEIARAATEQTRNSKHVAEAARRTSEMVQQISVAMNEQRLSSEQLLQNAQSALALCQQVHRSTEEQRESSTFVQSSITSITEMIRSIYESAESHSRASEAVSKTTERILQIGNESVANLPAALSLLEELRAEAEGLVREIGRFR